VDKNVDDAATTLLLLSATPSLAECTANGKWPDGAAMGKKCRHSPFLQPKYADMIRDGSKTHEGRPLCGFVKPSNMEEGKLAIAENDFIGFKITGTSKTLYARVLEIRCYPKPQGFLHMIRDVGAKALLPDFTGTEHEAAELYRTFANQKGSYRDLEAKHGAVALRVQYVVA
jgi:ASC-1-like (ASCH) protein